MRQLRLNELLFWNQAEDCGDRPPLAPGPLAAAPHQPAQPGHRPRPHPGVHRPHRPGEAGRQRGRPAGGAGSGGDRGAGPAADESAPPGAALAARAVPQGDRAGGAVAPGRPVADRLPAAHGGPAVTRVAFVVEPFFVERHVGVRNMLFALEASLDPVARVRTSSPSTGARPGPPAVVPHRPA